MQQNEYSFVRSATYERSHALIPGNNILMVARVKGEIIEKDLRTSIQKIQQRHPLLRVHLEFEENSQTWFVSDSTGDIPLKIYTRTSEKAWIEACYKENKIPYQMDREPLIRVLWLKNGSISELILFGQHVICDGTSLVFLMRDLLNYLGNPAMEVEVLDKLPTLDKAVNLDQIKLNPIIRKLLTKFAQVWKNNEIHFSFEDIEPFRTVFNASNYQILIHEMSLEETNQLIQTSREHKVTVNSVLYSALISAQLEIQGNEKNYQQIIMLPIDLRAYMDPPIGEVVGLYAGGETFPHKVKLDKEFWRRTRDLHRYLKKHITRNGMLSNAKRAYMIPPSLMDARMMLILGNKLPESNPKYEKLVDIVKQEPFLRKLQQRNLTEEMTVGMVLTNLGKMEIPLQYGELELESLFFVPPASLVAEKIVGILTIGGQLRIAISYLEKYLKNETAQQLLDRALEIVKENLGSENMS